MGCETNKRPRPGPGYATPAKQPHLDAASDGLAEIRQRKRSDGIVIVSSVSGAHDGSFKNGHVQPPREFN